MAAAIAEVRVRPPSSIAPQLWGPLSLELSLWESL
jgi:hypothetical protein